MENKQKKRYNYRTQRAASTHVLMLVIVGGYLAYLGWKMIDNARSGNTSMSLTQSGLLAALMILAALGVFGYAAYLYLRAKKDSELTEEEAKALDERIARAELEELEEPESPEDARPGASDSADAGEADDANAG